MAPLIHGSLVHLLANLLPLFFLGTCLYFFYDRIADMVWINCYLLTNVIVWIFGRPYFHIGSSGLVYGLAVFLICLGLFRASIKSILISIAVILTYGSIIYGIIPSASGRVSWESHLAGTCVGMFMAFFYSQKPKLSRY
ncbi:rhomboid family intramembrane serine protease [Pleomorphovibrio marinus]|uniref:rhomboid family intramembrane serine protease n=1 Tax=Pleomorphovibrio marinus TaxID=2164132 RepID=UPI001E4E37D2|nr:rhomboid family intramembrane serine protease [Pleomorphovibrio marinus]